MNATTLNAAIEVLIDRWPFPDGAEEFKRDFVNGLKLAVSDWTGRRQDGFKKAVQALVADKFRAKARPTVDDIVDLALSKAGDSPRPGPSNVIPESELARDRERRHAEWRAECERRRADPEEAQKAVDSFARGAMFWRVGSRERRHIAEWLRDFWNVDFQPGEFDAFIAAPSTQHPRDPRRIAPNSELPERGEPVPVASVVAEVAARGFSGLSDAALGSAEEDKARRAKAHRERVAGAYEDFAARRRGEGG